MTGEPVRARARLLSGRELEAARARAIRRDVAAGIPIAGFTGINGAGKTTLAVQSAIADMARGRTVYSTVAITSSFGSSEPILSLRQLLELRDVTLLLDDISVIFSSRSSQSLPPEIVALLQTLRHSGVTVRWTAPAWMRCDNLVREVTQALVNVVPMLRKHERENPWPRPRVVLAGVLDTSVGKADATPTRVMRRRLVVPTRLDSWGAFDSRADTPLLGRHLQSGRCVDCGGSIDTPKHNKARHELLGLPWYEGEIARAPRAVAFGSSSSDIVLEKGDSPAEAGLR